MLAHVVEEASRFVGRPAVISSAPGRLDFLNTHQDYKGLPVVGIGVNLRTYVVFAHQDGNRCWIGSGNMLDEGVEYFDEFDVSRPDLTGRAKWFGDYMRAAVRVLLDEGVRVRGFRAWIRSWIPVASGLGSSGALLVAFIGGLLKLSGVEAEPKYVAELAYRAEHDVMGIPCGRLDQYSSAFGDVAVINTKPPYSVEKLRLPDDAVFLVVDTGIRHSTAEIHPRRQAELNEGLRILKSVLPQELTRYVGAGFWDTDWENLMSGGAEKYLEHLLPTPRKRLEFTFRVHRSTLIALKAIRGEGVAPEEIMSVLGLDEDGARRIAEGGPLKIVGEVMYFQHRMLSEYYDVSLPQIDRLVDTLIELGALGAKLSGAGLGGAVIALFSSADGARRALDAVLSRGEAPRGWIVKVDRGLEVATP